MVADAAPAMSKVGDSGHSIESVLEARALAYDLLKCAFLQEPSVVFIRLLIESTLIPAFPFADGNDAIARALEKIRRYVEQPDVLSQQASEGLRWDYTRMFVGPGRPPAPPWESVYRDGEHLHFSAETLRVRAAYRTYGLAPEDAGHEPDDHIGLELSFLHTLCEMASEKAKRADEAGLAAILEDQRIFLDDHILRWVPDWTRDVTNNADTAFYRGMAELLDAYVALDRDIVEVMLEALRQDAPGPPSRPDEKGRHIVLML